MWPQGRRRGRCIRSRQMAHVTSSSTTTLVSREAEGDEAVDDVVPPSQELDGRGEEFLLAGEEEAEDIPEVEGVAESSLRGSLILPAPMRGALRVLGRLEGFGRGGRSAFTFI